MNWQIRGIFKTTRKGLYVADYIPPADDAKFSWLCKPRPHIDDHSATLGISAGRVTRIEAWCADAGASARSLAAVFAPIAGAGIDPVPAFGFLPCLAPARDLAPVVALAYIPSVELQVQMVGLDEPASSAARVGRVRSLHEPARN
jgi:hypothetical protein